MQTARCPLCNSDIILEEESYEGDLVDCANCESELEIVSLHPPQVSEIKADNELEQKDIVE